MIENDDSVPQPTLAEILLENEGAERAERATAWAPSLDGETLLSWLKAQDVETYLYQLSAKSCILFALLDLVAALVFFAYQIVFWLKYDAFPDITLLRWYVELGFRSIPSTDWGGVNHLVLWFFQRDITTLLLVGILPSHIGLEFLLVAKANSRLVAKANSRLVAKANSRLRMTKPTA